MLYIIQARVADVFAFHQVNNVFADITGMIANTLQCPHEPHDVE